MAIIIYDEKPGGEILTLDVYPNIILGISQLHDVYLPHTIHTRLREILKILVKAEMFTEIDKLTDLILELDDWPKSREESLVDLFVFWSVITLRPWPRMSDEVSRIFERRPELCSTGVREIHKRHARPQR